MGDGLIDGGLSLGNALARMPTVRMAGALTHPNHACARMHALGRARAHARAHTYARAHARAHTHTHTHTHAHAHAHTHIAFILV